MKTSLNFREKPFAYLLLSAVFWIITIIAHLLFDRSIEDKLMFGFPVKSIIWVFPAFLFLLWLLYLATRKLLYSDTLTRVHVLTTAITSLMIATVLLFAIAPATKARNQHELLGLAMQWLTFIFVFSQLLYLINFGLGRLMNQKK